MTHIDASAGIGVVPILTYVSPLPETVKSLIILGLGIGLAIYFYKVASRCKC